MKNFGILRLYCGETGKKGFYNMQELGLAKALVKKQFYVYIFLLNDKCTEIQSEKIEASIELVYLPAGRISIHGFFRCSYLLKYKLDVLQIQSDNQLFAPIVAAFCKKKKLNYYFYVGTVRSDTNSRLKKVIMKLFTAYILWGLKRGNVFVKTPSMKEELCRLGISKVHVAPVGLDFDMIRPIELSDSQLREKYSVLPDKKLLLFVGHLEEYKNPLMAVELLNGLGQEYYLIMVGKGSLKQKLLQKIQEYDLADCVKLIDQLPNQQIHELYKMSDYFVNFNTKEIYGMSILEAMYQNCTVIAMKAPGPEYIIEHAESGYVVDDLEKMSDLIEADRKVEIDLADRVRQKFSWDNTAEIIISEL